MLETALSLSMLMIIALPIGAYVLSRRGGSRRQVALMLVLAVVMAVNVVIWLVPTSDGTMLAQSEPK